MIHWSCEFALIPSYVNITHPIKLSNQIRDISSKNCMLFILSYDLLSDSFNLPKPLVKGTRQSGYQRQLPICDNGKRFDIWMWISEYVCYLVIYSLMSRIAQEAKRSKLNLDQRENSVEKFALSNQTFWIFLINFRIVYFALSPIHIPFNACWNSYRGIAFTPYR